MAGSRLVKRQRVTMTPWFRLSFLLGCLVTVPLDSVGAAEPQPVEIRITGPMIVGFFPPVSDEELESDPGARAGVAHLKFALSDVAACLKGRGVVVKDKRARALIFKYDGKVERIKLPTDWPRAVGAYLLDPKKPPRVVYASAGPSSLGFLLPNAAADYFGASKCRKEL
jgi:hypothetical protein